MSRSLETEIVRLARNQLHVAISTEWNGFCPTLVPGMASESVKPWCSDGYIFQRWQYKPWIGFEVVAFPENNTNLAQQKLMCGYAPSQI